MNETLADILPRLDGVRKIRGGYMANCPAHDDQHASLSIKVKDGKPIIFCHAGCSFKEIISTLNLNSQQVQEKTIETTYDYCNETGELKYQVVRFQPKSFRHRRPDGQGGWIWNRKNIEPLLYQLPELIGAINNDEYVFIVEGEKDCQTLKGYGFIATTCSGGVKGWQPQFTGIFHKAKVIIIPDNDDAGWEYANEIAKILYGWAKSLKVIKLDVPQGDDVTDFLTEKTIDKLMNIIKNSPEFTPIGAITREEYHTMKGHLIYLHGLFNKLEKSRSYKKDIYLYSNIKKEATE